MGKAGRRAMIKEIILLALCSLVLAPCTAVEAQQAEKIFRIAYLDPGNASGSAVLVEAFGKSYASLDG
jgi:hypothetical protein